MIESSCVDRCPTIMNKMRHFIKVALIFKLKISRVSINSLRFITKSILSMDRLTKDSVEWFNQYLVLPIGRDIELIKGACLHVSFNYNSGDEIDVLQESLVVEMIRNNNS